MYNQQQPSAKHIVFLIVKFFKENIVPVGFSVVVFLSQNDFCVRKLLNAVGKNIFLRMWEKYKIMPKRGFFKSIKTC